MFVQKAKDSIEVQIGARDHFHQYINNIWYPCLLVHWVSNVARFDVPVMFV